MDKVGTACDNCPYVYNPDQKDDDKDGVGNACEKQTLAQIDGKLDEPIESNNDRMIIAELMEKLLKMYYNN